MSGDDKKPTNPIVAYAGLIAAIAGLISSITAYQKASQEQVARDSYKTTAAAIDRLSDESAMNHADIVALRQYLVDHVSAPYQGPPSPSASSPPVPPAPPVIQERRRPVVVSRTGGGGAKGASADTVVVFPLTSTSGAAPTGQPAPAKAPPAPARMPDEWPE